MLKLDIESKISVGLSVNPATKRWQDFIDFAANRAKEGQDVAVFITWLKNQPKFDLTYWPPSKMQEFWPQAFPAQPAQLAQPTESGGYR